MAEKEIPRLARLTAILLQLQSKRLVTATQLAERHDVTVRTIYRDISTLQQSGVPIVTEEGRGYSLIQGYHLPPVMFTAAEANALITASQIISKNKDQSLVSTYDQVVSKIRAVMNHSQQEKIELLEDRIQVRANLDEEHVSAHLIKLQSMITDYEIADIMYAAAEGQITHRKVEPFALYTTQEVWVLIAYCRLRQEFRAFRLDRILRLDSTGQMFSPHKMTLQQYFEICREKYLKGLTPDIGLS